MQISWSKYFEQKQQERILLTTSLMKDIHDMTEKEKIIYRKYVHKWQKYEESEESKDPNDTKKNAENQFQDKKKIPEDSRVQPDPQTSKKRENLKRKETSKKTEMPNVSSIYLSIYLLYIIMSCHKYGFPWLSQAIHLYHPLLLAGLQHYILCLYRAVVD